MKTIKRTEQDLAKDVVEWLENQRWDVYQEVKAFGHIADIVAIGSNLVWVIECKRSLTLSVMEQAYGWRTHLRSIAVPYTKRKKNGRSLAYEIAKNYLKIGVIEVSNFGIREVVNAPLMKEYSNSANHLESLLREEHKHFAKAGSNSGGYYTPYQATIKAIKKFIGTNPGSTLKEIIDVLGKGHYASNSSCRQSLNLALTNWEKDWCRCERGHGTVRFYIR
jgi:hypothetical protein